MKTIKCSDIGPRGCGFAAVGKNDAEVKKALLDHARKDHADMMKKMTPVQMKQAEDKMNAILAKQKSS